MNTQDYAGIRCPLPIADYPRVLLAHGSGGRLMHQLIDQIFLSAFGKPGPQDRHDGAIIDSGNGKMAFTTDSYVVRPLFFPGGDIGTLAVYGTVNDLAMCGAQPQWMSAGFIVEEGFSLETLWRIARSMRRAADRAAVRIITGDTKVVEKGKGDGVFINTTGIGTVGHKLTINPASVRPGDVILLSGDIGRHGIAIMAEREGLSFETKIESDCAPLVNPVRRLIDAGIEVHCLRDLTRGGLATALVEISEASGLHLQIDEWAIPVSEEVHAACELLGFDPLHVANEGRFVAFVPPEKASQALKIMQADPSDSNACVIGRVLEQRHVQVTLKTEIGGERILDMLSGEQLPRIC